MNTTLTPRLARSSPTRAQFSPVLSRRLQSHPLRSEVLPVRIPVPAISDVHPAWPAWHRGPLDRLQPMLTRYRD